ncbi:hypothetical protein F5876DRAFT_74337 [Lentinula aff. lateritia]|uniref:Uncharacterized protein n=1 Tax=Lentinula aff. lateritia TaxID=2804960 RepID=A0ACC1U7D8_9AGAR|nr:hypothetical protein F5876DRAFT_74337 [Lentinula aff. lateritia]
MARGALWYLSETLLGTWWAHFPLRDSGLGSNVLKLSKTPDLQRTPRGNWTRPSGYNPPRPPSPLSQFLSRLRDMLDEADASDMESDMDLDTDPEAEAPPANQIIELIELLALVELQEAIQKRLLPSDFAVQGLGIGDGISVGTGVEMVVMSQLSAICDTIAADKKANKSWLERIEEALRKANNTKAPQTISTSPN